MSTVSMTGFGRGEASDGRITAVAELSTVNRKQFDCHLSLPKELAALESRIETLLHQFIYRGQIKGTVTVAFAKSTGGLTVNLDLAKAQAAADTGPVPDSKAVFKAYLATAADALSRLMGFIESEKDDVNMPLFLSKVDAVIAMTKERRDAL